jgi:methyl-accepting chemotaxis protein
MRLTVKSKLAGAFGIVIILSMIAGGVAYLKLGEMVATAENLVERASRMDEAAELEKGVLRQVRAEKNMIISASDADAEKFAAEIVKFRVSVNKTKGQISAAASEDGKVLVERFATAYSNMNTIQDQTVKLAKLDKAKAIELSLNEGRIAVTEANEAAQSYVVHVKKAMDERTEQAKLDGARAQLLLLVLVISSLVIAAAAATWISLNISRGLSRAVGLADAVATGDLTKTLKATSNDEVGDLIASLNNTVERLRAVVTDTLTASQNMSAGSQELSASAEQLSQGATEQASASEEASASMEEMAANVKQNAGNASQTEKIAHQSAQDAEASGVAVSRAVEAMQTIAGKITIVQEIARQTDLLALNAAVEAARAGEHGKGFAVVASEVRKLAERSQTAAAEIGALSGETVKAAQEAGAMLARLVPDIKKTAQLVEEITAACREQDVGSSQINQAIQQLDKVGQQNSSASEQVSSTAEELASQAEQLQSTISFFKIDQPQNDDPRPAAGIDKAVAQLRSKAATMSAPQRGAKKPAVARPARALKVAGGSGGFALEMNDGADERDADFKR